MKTQGIKIGLLAIAGAVGLYCFRVTDEQVAVCVAMALVGGLALIVGLARNHKA